LLSDSKYTNNELTIVFLKHFIKHINASLNKLIKVLLINSYISYTTLEFVLWAIEMNIYLYPFLLYLTYIMQPFNVSVFQPYKH
jgi:hypothetical protein